jgi:hypothetical protein
MTGGFIGKSTSAQDVDFFACPGLPTPVPPVIFDTKSKMIMAINSHDLRERRQWLTMQTHPCPGKNISMRLSISLQKSEVRTKVESATP